MGIKNLKYLNPKLADLSYAYLDTQFDACDLVQDEVEIRSIDGVILVLGRRVSPNVAFLHRLYRYAKWAFLRLEIPLGLCRNIEKKKFQVNAVWFMSNL